MKRVAAVVVAAVMVVGALFLRGAIGDDSGEDVDAVDTAAETDGVWCPGDLAEVCGAVTVAGTETAGETADRLIAAARADELDAEAWIVPAAWASLVVEERARLGRDELFAIDADPIASTGISLAIWVDRAEQLGPSCGDVDWRCLADRTGDALTNGDLVRAIIPPVDSALGLPVAGAASANLLGRSDFAANDFDATFRSRVRRLAAGQSPDPLTLMRSRGPGAATGVGVADATVGNLSSTFGSILTVVPEPAVRVDLVALVPRGSSLDGDVRRALATAATGAGWSAPGADPGTAGRAAGGVLAAVRSVWSNP